MEKHCKITKQLLLDNNFTESSNIDGSIYYIDKSKQIIFTQGWSNREYNGWNVHIDNEDMETIGSADIIYAYEYICLLCAVGLINLAKNFIY